MTEVLSARPGLRDRFDGLSVSGHQTEGNHGQTDAKSNTPSQQASAAAASGRTSTHTQDKSSASPDGVSPRGVSAPLAIPTSARKSASPTSSPGSEPQLYGSHNSSGEPVYHGRLSSRKYSFSSLNTGSPVEVVGSYQGRLGCTKDVSGDESAIRGLGSTGEVQRLITPGRKYHGAHGDTTGSSPPGPGYEPPSAPQSSGSGRLQGNILQRECVREDPFGSDQQYHGPLA